MLNLLKQNKEIFNLHPLLRQPLPKPSISLQNKEARAKTNGLDIYYNAPNTNIANPSHKHPRIKTDLLPFVERSLAYNGAQIAIETE